MSHFGSIRFADSPSTHEWLNHDRRTAPSADRGLRKALGRKRQALEWIGLLIIAALMIATGGVVGSLIAR